jgi:integrase/recombinase XerD
MATVSIVYRKDKRNKKGEAPIHFRIIKDRKITYISTGIMISEDYWDFEKNKIKSKHPNSKRLKSFIDNKYVELQDEVFDKETNQKSLTSRQLRDKIYGMKPTDFFAFADSIVENYKTNNQFSTHDKNKSIIKKLKDYVDNRTLTFQDIDVEFLEKYEYNLRTKEKNKTNTIHKDFKFIRKVFNDAFQKELIEYHVNPFHKYKLKSEKTQRCFLTEDELKDFGKVPTTPGTKVQLHQNMFIFASYTGGLRVSDMLLLQWKHFDGTNINFTIAKTGSQLSIKVPTKGLEILKKYKPTIANADAFIFPMLPPEIKLDDPQAVDIAISRATAHINNNLKRIKNDAGIGKHISFHISRHTWATRALKKGMSIDKVSKLMGHAAIRETQIYAKIVNTELDKAMDVFND